MENVIALHFSSTGVLAFFTTVIYLLSKWCWGCLEETAISIFRG